MSKIKGISKYEFDEIEDEHEYLTKCDTALRLDLEEQQTEEDERDYQEYLRDLEYDRIREEREHEELIDRLYRENFDNNFTLEEFE